ncbi:TAXI family TRAP transporter solute-binding subunit [Marinobacterium jannaschii]|uniref:TAXI family TRAP transporter solute-binding subunit n=1 Tax=Marinobacterium jannaschii TaxID=64970 RepID=UPI001B80C4D6|nr:TAXI family TRAP transporter solute-binding subunit [Marinobacterium jannaschii]
MMLALIAVPAQAGKQLISLGTGGVTGVYYPAGGAICRLVNLTRKSHGIRCAVESTGGSYSNIQRVEAGELDLGIAEAGFLYRRVQAGGSRQDSRLRSLFSLYTEYFTILARADSSIQNFEDIEGKKVSIGAPGSAQRLMFDLLLAVNDKRAEGLVTPVELEAARQAKALCSGQIDVMLYTVGHPSGAAREATRDCSSHLISLRGAAAQKLVQDNPWLYWAEIPGGTYPGNPHSTRTLGLRATLFASDQLSEQQAYTLVKAVFQQIEQLRQMHPAFSGLQPSTMAQGPFPAPLHPGAKRYFTEAGLLPGPENQIYSGE